MKLLGLFDRKECYARIDKNGAPLVELNVVIPWKKFRPVLSNIFNKIRKSNAGAKPYDVVLMFKVLVLQSLYNLSDDGIEYQIRSLSFMRFLALVQVIKCLIPGQSGFSLRIFQPYGL